MSHAIEHDFPTEELNRVAALESWRKEVHRPMYHIHKWWATRLGSVFRTILLAGLLDENENVWANFYRQHQFKDKVVFDPFMGSGTTLGEALKLGCRALGCDINPVSYFLVREVLRFVEKDRLVAGFQRLENRARGQLRPYYLSEWEGTEVDLLYTFWVKTIPCPDCGETSRLFSKWIFVKNAFPARKPESRCLCPVCGQFVTIDYQDTVANCRTCHHRFNPQEGPARRTTFVCEHCQREHPIAETYRATGRPPEHAMYALLLLLPDGEKVYKQPTDKDRATYAAACDKLRASRPRLPDEEIAPGVNTDQARGYNYLRWRDMFNDRQLYALGTLLDEVLKEPDEDVRRQFLLLFSGTLEFNNLFCSFKGEGTGAVRHLFSHHILKPERAPLENNPWGTSKSSGTFSTLFERRLLAAREYAACPFEIRPTRHKAKDAAEKVHFVSQPIQPRLADRAAGVEGRAGAFLYCGDAAKAPIPDNSVDLVVTDPPYFDNVHYSELADFFHVWLRLGLEANDPAFGNATTRSEREVQGTCADGFAALLGDVFAECARVLRPGGLLAFTFHHSRDEAWLAVLGALCKAGMRVVITHPIKAEMSVATPKSQAKEPINLDCIIVSRRASETAEARDGQPLPAPLDRAAALVRRFNQAGTRLSKGDVRVIVMGELLREGTAKAVSAENGQAPEFVGRFTAAIDRLHKEQEVSGPLAPEPVQQYLF